MSEVLDTQQVEIVGTNFVVGQLIADRIEVARPERDRGIDLIAYLDREDSEFVAVPLQIKAASGRTFGYWEKYSRTPQLGIILVWNVADPPSMEAYGLTHQECVQLGQLQGYDQTESWAKGNYITTRPSQELVDAMSRPPGAWGLAHIHHGGSRRIHVSRERGTSCVGTPRPGSSGTACLDRAGSRR